MKTIQTKLINEGTYLKVLLSSLLLLLSVGYASAQSKITGTITDETGEGLPGATVMEKGTTNGTTTDLDGQFQLEVNDPASLVISFVGYITSEVEVGTQSVINAKLNLDIKSLEEVVVVGYGEQTKQTMTGAVEVVKADAFKSQAVNNPILSLQGQTPGVLVSRASGRPGNEEIEVQVRGATSINGGDVLYVIDGAIALSTEFNNMNPDDIESVTVLKDGAAAIYGSRASNGVILVTTKQGSGKMSIEYNGSFRIKKVGREPEVPSMQEFGAAWLAAVDGEGDENYMQWSNRENLIDLSNGVARVYQTTIGAWGDAGAMYLAPANRFDEMYGDAYSFQHTLSISGSTEKTKYRLSGNFSDDTGALKVAYDGQKQYTFRLNLDQKVTDRISVDLGMSHQLIKTSGPSSGFSGTGFSSDPPIFPAYNPYGDWYANFEFGGRNVTGQSADGGRENSDRNLTRINIGLTADIIDGLEFRALASFRQSSTALNDYVLEVPLYAWDGDLAESANPNTSIRTRYSEANYELYNAYLTYTKTIGSGHNFKLMAGVTAELDRSSWVEATTDGIEDLGVYTPSVATGLETNDSEVRNSGFYSYMSRFNYDYNGRYLFELLGRSDASSKFDNGFKRENYFGASAGWVVSEEGFLSNNSILSFWKLKISFAEMGNTAGIGDHDYVSQIGFETTPFGITPALQSAARVDGVTSNLRTWERVQMTNFGTEFSFLNNKLVGSFDYFIKNNPNMLASQGALALLGDEAPTLNIGHLRTKGWEVMLGWRDEIGDFKYGVSVNMGDARNKIVSLEGAGTWTEGLNEANPDNNGVPYYREGKPLNTYWMWATDGLFQTQEEVDAYYEQFNGGQGSDMPLQGDVSELRVGDVKKLDLDGNGVIQGISDDGGDLKYMGDADAHYYFGINSNVSWKGFDLVANFQGHLVQNIQRTGNLAFPFRAGWSNQTPAFLGKTWTEDNTDADFPRATTNSTRAGYNWDNNDFRLQNSRYIRLKTLVIGYTFPQSLINPAKLSNLRVYFSGNDLWEATTIDDGYDPEGNSFYPFMRSYAMGISAKF